MKTVARLLTTIGLLATVLSPFSAYAADTAPRKVALLDTGGPLKITISAPADSNGPIDFLGGDGVFVSDNKFRRNREVSFTEKLGEHSVAQYNAKLITHEAGKEKLTPDLLADYMLSYAGFYLPQAKAVDAPATDFPEAQVKAYRAEGQPFGKAEKGKRVVYVVVVVFPSGREGYSLLGAVSAPPAEFDANPAKFDQAASKVLADLLSNSKVEKR